MCMKIKRISVFVIMVTITSSLYGASSSKVDDSTAEGSTSSVARAAAVQGAIAGFEAFKKSEGVVTIPGKVAYDYAYSLSLGVEKSNRNIQGAVYFCKLAAEAGYAKAQYRYGAVLSEGIDVQQDTVAARSLLDEAYKQLVAEYGAQYRVVNTKSSVNEKNELRYARIHMENVKSDLWRVCLKHAKDTSDPESIRIVFRLGADHIEEVRDSLILLADGGCADAQYEYGKMLVDNDDDPKGFCYLELAAGQGHAAACEFLKEMDRDDSSSSEDESADPASAAAATAGIKRRRGDG